MQQVTEVKIRSITLLGRHDAGIFRLVLDLPAWGGWQPGQFVMVREIRPDTRLTWARPFCISHTDEESLTIYFQVVGRATRELAKLQAGAKLSLWGPLGNSLVFEKDAPTLLLAGGMGIAPLLGYAQSHLRPENLELKFGHRLPLECYPFDLFKFIKTTFYPETCLNDRDCFIRIIDERMAELSVKNTNGKGLVLACGPTPFLRTIQGFAQKHGTRTQVSLETRMACGIGACLGCVVKASDQPEKPGHFVQTCTCGPNFWADRVEL